MAGITMKQLLEAGVHFGHQTKKWNPKMRKFIFTERNGIYIIDLQKTMVKVREAFEFLRKVVEEKKPILFVGTKKQAQEAVREDALRCGEFFVNQRWLGGTMTNYQTIQGRINRLKELERRQESGDFEKLPKKEKRQLEDQLTRLNRFLAGIKNMPGLPGVLFVIDSKNEAIAIAEARKLEIPVVAIVDTNADPDEIDHPIPGNDDAIRAIKLFTSAIADLVIESKGLLEKAQEEAAQASQIQVQVEKTVEEGGDVIVEYQVQE